MPSLPKDGGRMQMESSGSRRPAASRMLGCSAAMNIKAFRASGEGLHRQGLPIIQLGFIYIGLQ